MAGIPDSINLLYEPYEWSFEWQRNFIASEKRGTAAHSSAHFPRFDEEPEVFDCLKVFKLSEAGKSEKVAHSPCLTELIGSRVQLVAGRIDHRSNTIRERLNAGNGECVLPILRQRLTMEEVIEGGPRNPYGGRFFVDVQPTPLIMRRS